MGHEKQAAEVAIQTGKDQYVLSTNGIITEWDATTGTGDVVRATSPVLVTPSMATGTVTNAPVAGTDISNKDYIDSKFPVTEANLSISNNTTGNVSTTKHGFTPLLSNNAAQFLNGQGNWATPSAGTENDFISQDFIGAASVDVVHNFGVYPVVQIIVAGVVTAPTAITHNSVNDFTVTFGGATTGTIVATVGSPQPQRITTVNNNYVALTTDRIIAVTASGKTVTLYAIAGNAGKEIIVDNRSTGDITVDGDGAETIQGETNQTIPPDCAIAIYVAATEWRIY